MRRIARRDSNCLTLTPVAITCAIAWAPTPVVYAQTQRDAPQRVDRVVVSSAREAPAPLSLDAPAETASTLGLPLRALPLSASIVDRDEMERLGARNTLEATTTSVGVTGGVLPGSNPRYTMRGFTDNNITLLRDGIRQNTMAQSSRPVDTFMLDRIEVLKGPSSMMHGEGAVAGAINYVSRAPSFVPITEATLAGGSYDAWRLGATTSRPFASGSAAFRLTAATSQTGAGYIPRSSSEINSAAASLTWKPNSQLTLDLAIDTQREDIDTWFGLPVIYDQAINTLNGRVRTTGPANTATDRLVNARIEPSTRRFNYNLSDSYNDGKNTFTRAKLAWRVSPEMSARLTAYEALHFLDWRNSENYVWNPNTSLVQRDLFYIRRDDVLRGARTDLVWTPKFAADRDFRVVVGFDANRNMLQRGTRAPGTLPASIFNVALDNPNSGATPSQFATSVPQADATVKTFAPFAEFAIDAVPNLKLVGGIRNDRIDIDRVDRINAAASTKQSYRPTTGRFGAVWSAARATQFYASVATSADPVQQFVSISAAQAALTLQRGRQYEAGIKHSSTDGRLDLTAAVYAIEKNNLLTTTLIGGVSTAQAVGGQSSRGVEVAAAWKFANDWSLSANAAWTRARFDDFAEIVANPAAPAAGQPATIVVQRAGNTPANVPEWTANALLSWRPAPGWELATSLQHVGKRQANSANLIQLPAFTLVGASVEYSWQSWAIGLRARNVLDRLYADWSINQGLQQRVGDPRTFEVTFRARF
jgi:iron complex outermembrane recepter protein